MDVNKSTLVLGATPNPSRYAYLAVQRLLAKKHAVYAFGIKTGSIDGVNIQQEWPSEDRFDTVTLYVGAKHQGQYYDSILSLKPKRVIFNPGTENPTFQTKLEQAGIETLEACTLVMLGAGTY